MKHIPLCANERHGIYWYDPERFSLTFEKANEKNIREAKCVGWGARIRSIIGKKFIVAFYVQSGTVWLQIDDRRWNLQDPRAEVEVKRRYTCLGLVNSFKVWFDGQQHFSCDYWSSYANLLNIIDPAYGVMEEEFDDFFLYIGKNANNKKWLQSLLSWEHNGM